MSTLLQRHDVRCPYQRARGFLADVLSIPAENGESRVITMRVPFQTNGTENALEKKVVVTFGKGIDPLHFDQPWTVRWTPNGGGPYPDFEGTLTVRADEDFTSCVLELQGHYDPPGGVAGAAFDAVVGSRIASATAREFLRRIGDKIEERYALEELEKRA